MRRQQTIIRQFKSALHQCMWIQFLLNKHGTVPQSALATWMPLDPEPINQMGLRLARKVHDAQLWHI